MHPNPRAPRCLPCAYADPLLGHYHNPLTFNATPVSLSHNPQLQTPLTFDAFPSQPFMQATSALVLMCHTTLNVLSPAMSK